MGSRPARDLARHIVYGPRRRARSERRARSGRRRTGSGCGRRHTKGPDPGGGEPDAGQGPDAGGGTPDTGGDGPDPGGGEPDAGQGPDAGGGTPDTGGDGPDPGGGEPDAGQGPDAGGGEPDAGQGPDADGGEPDADGVPGAGDGPDPGGGEPDEDGGEPDPTQGRDDGGDDDGDGDTAGPVAVGGSFNDGFGEGTFVGTYDPATGAFAGTFTDPDGTFTVSFDPATGVVTEVEDGVVTTYDGLAEFQSENPAVSVEIAVAIDVAETLALLEVNPETGALEGTFTDEDGTFTISIDRASGVVTETGNGETIVYESLEAFLSDEDDDAGGGIENFGGDVVPF